MSWPEPREGFGADAFEWWRLFNGMMPGGAWVFIKCEGKRPVESWPDTQRDNPNVRANTLRGWRGNLGYPCGLQPGGWWLVLVDHDPRTDTNGDSLALLRSRGMTIETVTTLTGGEPQGSHFWFRAEVEVRKASLPEYPGVDFLGEGALAIVPPSTTVRQYEFEHRFTLDAADIAPLPLFLIEALTGKRAPVHEHDVPEALAEARLLLEKLGGHGYQEFRTDGVVWAKVTRPGKPADGTGSATVGRLGNPGAVHVFTTNWPTLPAGTYNLAELRRMAGVEAPEARIVRIVPPARTEVVEAFEPAPVPLDVTPELPPFPVEVFPEWARTLIEQVAIATQTPADLPAMVLLAALAAASGGRVIAVPHSGWEEPTNLFVAVAMPPASRKSPVFRLMVEPLRLAERGLMTEAHETIVTRRAEKLAAEAQARALLTEASKLSGADADNKRGEAVTAQLLADAVNVPTPPRILASDATPEALTTLLSTYGGRIAVLSAEGGVFDQIAGRYSGKPALDVYLNGHAGDALHVDRIGRAPEFIARPALTIGITTQPSTFRALARVRDIKGRGLLGRFLWSMPPDNIGYREVATPAVEGAVLDTYTDRMVALTESLAGWEGDPFRAPFNVPAQVAVSEYGREVEVWLRDGERLGHVREWGGKVVGAVVRIATLLHLATHEGEAWRSSITPDEVEAARAVGDYLTAHALAVFAFMAREEPATNAEAVLRFAVGCSVPFSVREAHRALQGRMNAAEVRDAVEHLVDLGQLDEVAPVKRLGPGRPPPTRYRVPTARDPVTD